MPAISVNGLERRFSEEVLAVAGIDLEVAEGEIYAFLGPNGAGKTTTVRMLVTLLRPTGGHASVAGFDIVKDASRVRASIGVALQEAALDPLMTGRELIQLQATLHGLPAAESKRRGDALLERVGLEDAADRRVGTYSGGMRRRLDLASALVHEPNVLFLDEPTTGLDPVSRMTIWGEVQQLNRDGTTVFLTTQYLEEADQLADRVGIIDAGKITAEDTPSALKADIGDPHLEIGLAGENPDPAKASEILARHGELKPARDGLLCLSVRNGAADIAPVVRALDEGGVAIGSLDLLEPSLDDVFVAKTGRHLEESKAKEAAEAGGAGVVNLRARAAGCRRACAALAAPGLPPADVLRADLHLPLAVPGDQHRRRRQRRPPARLPRRCTASSTSSSPARPCSRRC